ncbi:MAG: hypothetical protein KGO49_15350 [Gammaproteobacteria bacterium]|nr:hypothetical protein [Gammaproteobacteria bacterium]
MYTVKRTNLHQYEMFTTDGRFVARSSFPAAGVWPAEGAPLTGITTKAKRDIYPTLEVNGISYTAHQRILTNKFFFNYYDIWLETKEGEKQIYAHLTPPQLTSVISIDDKKYLLRRQSIIRFHYSLLTHNHSELARYTETTNFLSLGVKRSFNIQKFEHNMDELLIFFTFWLSATATFL